jgi:hypothetical protein
MTIDAYIKKHKLRRFAKWPATNLQVNEVLIDPPSDVFELYRDSKSAHFVSVNMTKGKFCILHSELVPHASEWCPIDLDTENDTQ